MISRYKERKKLMFSPTGRLIPGFMAMIFIIFSFISCQRGKLSEAKKGKMAESINKAVSWVQTHPANFNDGLFIEIAEEIITFYILTTHTHDVSKKEQYLGEIKKRLDLISSQKDFSVQPFEYTMFLALAKISEELGLKSYDFRKIIGTQIISDPLLYPEHVTTQIWNTAYLERLGYRAPKTLEEVLPYSTLSKEVQQRLLFQYTSVSFDPLYIDPVSTTIYDLTHEIFSLTDFGKVPPPFIIEENSTFYSDLFDQSIKWAISATHVDVLAELIMCVKILNLKDVSSTQNGIDFIISCQEQDGSFGMTNPGRRNVYRHGILVSIMALSLSS